MVRDVFIYRDYFWEFYYQQNDKVRAKINWTLQLIRELRIVPETYLKHITGTDLYEIRVVSGTNIFRIFCFFDEGNLIVLLSGFQKKTQKTPAGEIRKAELLKDKYYEDKEKHNDLF